MRGYLSLAEDPFFRGLLDLCRLDAALDPQPVTYLMSSLRSDQDNGYSLDSRSFTTAVAALRSCRHALGWHPGYYAATDRDRLRLEKSRLEDALGEQVVRSRFHLLRWSAKYSWDDLEAVGIREDSSVGYADLPGFRCGTCHPFQTFSLTQQCRLELVEVPLIIMDATLRGMRRLGTYDRQLLGKLSSRVARAGGTLAVLIHNSFGDFGDEKVLCDLIGELLRFRCDPDCTSPLFDLSLPGAGVIAKCYRQAVAELWHPWEPTGAQ